MINPDLAFSAINLLVFPAWALLIFAPHWRWTDRLVHAALWPLVFGALYLIWVSSAIFFEQGDENANFSTIEGVRAIFASDIGVLVGWIHYLVFDLFVGAWIARDGRRRGVPHLPLIPCLLLAFMFGPVGLLLYLIMRKLMGKGGWSLMEG